MTIVNYNLDGTPIEETPVVASTTEEPTAVENDDAIDDAIPDDINDVEPVSEEEVRNESLGLEQCRDDLFWLLSMHRTIGLEGICKQDMRSLRLVQQRLTDTTGMAFGNEHYGDGMFFDDRSMLNKSIGQESFARTITRTIMDWIKRLIQYLGKLYQWAKTTLVGESKYKFGFTTRQRRYEVARNYRAKLEAHTKTEQRTKAVMDEHTRELINNDRVVANVFTNAALGNLSDVADLDNLLSRASDSVAVFLRELNKLKDDIQKNTASVSVVESELLTINKVTRELEFRVNNTNNPHDLDIPRDTFNLGVPKATFGVVPFDHFMDACYEAQRIVKQIRRVENESNLQHIANLLNGVTSAVTNIGGIISMVKLYNDTRLQALELFVNYEDKYITEIHRVVKTEIKDTSLSEFVDRVIQEARAEIGKI